MEKKKKVEMRNVLHVCKGKTFTKKKKTFCLNYDNKNANNLHIRYTLRKYKHETYKRKNR